MGPAQDIGYLLQHLSAVLAKQSDQALQERLGVGFSQVKILRVLQANPSIRQREIADWLGQTEASISRQIKLMIDKGLLRTAVNPHNRREHLTTPTPRGLRMADESLQVLNYSHTAVFERLGAKKQQQLLEALTLMHHSACQPGRIGACTHPFSI